jgi:hypothetical protein
VSPYYFALNATFEPNFPGAASFTIYNRTKELIRDHNYLNHYNILDVALVGGISGAMSGALISFGSAREFPFYLLSEYC